MISLLEVLQRSSAFLAERGVQDARLSSEWILAQALELQRLDLYLQFERPLNEDQLSAIRRLIKRRANREPLQHILGTVDFYGLTLKTDGRALIPRPETEYLVELLHTRFLNREPTCMLDLGTGSGAIALALLKHFPECRAVAVDSSAEALGLAEENAQLAGLADRLELLQSDWFEKVEGSFELIVSNPPYLTAEEMESAEPEIIRFEPQSALSGGVDGLRDLRHIVEEGFDRLEDGGMLVLETGIRHHEALTSHSRQRGYSTVKSVKDLNRRDRYLVGVR